MTITYVQVRKKLLITLPFELKDSLKENFKNARWNADERKWTVPASAEKRLNQWIEATADVVKDLELQDTEELTSNEIKSIEKDVLEIRKAIALLRKEKKIYGASTSVLNSARAELKKVQEEFETEKAEVTRKKAEAKALIEKICDVGAIAAAHHTMMRECGNIGSQSRESYQDAQALLDKENDRLKKAGFVSKGLSELISMNFNRPDRDNPSSVSFTDILDICKYQEED